MGIRVLVVDDHEIMRAGLKCLLTHEPGYEVVGEAATGRATIDMVREHGPEILVLDVCLPDMNGAEVIRALHREGLEVRTLALSSSDDQGIVASVLQAGAAGYLTKECAFEELGRAIHEIADGKSYLAPTVAGEMLEHYLRHDGRGEDGSHCPISRREQDVLRLIASGLTTKEIAEHLFISPRTVETHRRNIMEKLKLRGVAELTRYAIRTGLAPLE